MELYRVTVINWPTDRSRSFPCYSSIGQPANLPIAIPEMRYNPDTERGITLERISQQCWAAVDRNQPELTVVPARVWDCRNGGWIQTLQATPIGRPLASIA